MQNSKMCIFGDKTNVTNTTVITSSKLTLIPKGPNRLRKYLLLWWLPAVVNTISVESVLYELLTYFFVEGESK